MKRRLWLLAVFVGVACSPPASTKDSGVKVPPGEVGNVSRVKSDDPGILAATRKAQSTLDDFLSKFRDRSKYKMTAVKFAMKVGDKTEHIWMDVEDFKHGVFEGSLANDSIYDPSIKVGKPVNVPREEVEDWMLMDQADRTEGGFSLETVQKHMR